MTDFQYSDGQLAALRAVIAGLPSLTPDEVAIRDAAVADGRCPLNLWPLWPLAPANPELWDSIIQDERIAEFSVYGLFPAAYDLVYGPQGGAAAIRYDGRTRGRVAIISGQRAGKTVRVVIKPCQSRGESEIARIAGELGVGPQQLPTIAGFISEEYVEGTFLTELPAGQADAERMRRVGAGLRDVINRLHDAGICYNDATLSDPDGRSHLLVLPDESLRLIDFGVALLLREHPSGLTFEDACNAARTDPMFRLFRQMSGDSGDGALAGFVNEYGRRLARQSAAEIQSRDWRFAAEGAAMVGQRLGPAAAAALRDGLGF